MERATTKPSIYSVAEKAGVSAGTVSRILNNSPAISLATREKVIRVMRELHFTPRKKTPKVAIVIAQVKDFSITTYLARMVSLLTFELANYGYLVNILRENEIGSLARKDYDAVVAILFRDHFEEFQQIDGLPVIFVNKPVPCGPHVSQIRSDHGMEARLAAEYLLENGHRKILFLENFRSSWSSMARCEAYCAALRRYDVRTEFVGFIGEKPLEEILPRALEAGCTAVLNFADTVQMQVPYFLTHVMKKRIPEDISLISEDLPDIFEYMTPPLTVVRQPLALLTEKVRQELERLIGGRNPDAVPMNEVLDVELIVRSSVKSLK